VPVHGKIYKVMVTPYKQIHSQKAHVPWQSNTKGWSTPHPLEINVLGELQLDDLSELINEHGGLTGAGQDVLGDMDNRGEFV